MMIRPRLYTKRLCLRPFQGADIPAIVTLAGDARVSAMTRNIPHPYQVKDAETWLALMQQHQRQSCVYAITERHSGALIGAMGLEGVMQTWPELGYWVGVPYWQQGYCTEAGQALLYYAFTRLGITHITAHHLEHNVASGRVMQKLGMLFARQSLLQTDEGPLKLHCYQLAAEQFVLIKAPTIVPALA